MALNKYMHPRNIYKDPTNFKQLAIDYPDFRQYAKQDLTGKVSIDFKDINAIRALTVTLLKKDFGLDVSIPLDRLIPTVPLRLNYVLWIEDLISISPKKPEGTVVKGIDIGTGSSCIFPLLISKRNGWKMVGTEMDRTSYDYAQENVMKNHLEGLISLKLVDKDTILKGAIDFTNEEYDFCMCNPPFFASVKDLNPFFKSRTNRRALPRSANTASFGDAVTLGGEVEFVRKMILESAELKSKIKIYTTMLGHKSSLNPLKSILRSVDVISFKHSEFYQGRTTRWGLSWTFCAIDLRKIPHEILAQARKKPKAPLRHVIACSETQTFRSVTEQIQNMLVALQTDVLKCEDKAGKERCAFQVTAVQETWKNQRRKRREEQRLNGSGSSVLLTPDNSMSGVDFVEEKSPSGVSETADMLSEINVHDGGKNKRVREEDPDETDDGYCNVKRMKTEEEEDPVSGSGRYVLKCTVVVYKQEEGICLEMNFDGDCTGNRETMHQLLQYFKNNLK